MLNLADFALQEQLEGNLMVAISRAWYNGSYTMAAKPIKSLELHYTMKTDPVFNNSCFDMNGKKEEKKHNIAVNKFSKIFLLAKICKLSLACTLICSEQYCCSEHNCYPFTSAFAVTEILITTLYWQYSHLRCPCTFPLH